MKKFSRRLIHVKKSLATAPDKQAMEMQKIEDEVDDPAALAAANVYMSAKKKTAYKIGKPRASRIMSACIRFHVIGTALDISKEEWSSVRSRLLFGYGNAYHYWMQNTGDIFGNRRIGWWRCRGCGKIMYFGRPPVKECKWCGARPEAAIYEEHAMDIDGKYPKTGHPDMFLEKQSGLYRVVEAKSINGKDFDKIKAPLHDHEVQCMTYMDGCADDPRLPVQIDKSLGYVLYISKRHKRDKLPFKMFKVKHNRNVINRVNERCAEYKLGVEKYPKNLPPVFPECDRHDFRNYLAKQCACRKPCMEMA